MSLRELKRRLFWLGVCAGVVASMGVLGVAALMQLFLEILREVLVGY